ncbi:MAG: thermonuclease family protein, partial [Acetobacteraceae bacterium]
RPRRWRRAWLAGLLAAVGLGLALLLLGDSLVGDDDPPAAPVAAGGPLVAPPGGAPSATPRGRVFQGPATVHDGDTIIIGDRRLRLHGIDAPEGDQTCQRDRRTWRCGDEATDALRGLLGSRQVVCSEIEEDRYRRPVVRCLVDGTDVNAWMVRQGWAVAFRRYALDYVGDEEAARQARRGLWSGSFVLPEEWRAGRR